VNRFVSPLRPPTAILTALVVVATVAGCSASGGTPSPLSTPSPTATATTAASNCPKSQPDPLPAGKNRIVTIETSKGSIQITVSGNLAPIAAGNFVALVSCGFYDGVVFHRLVPGFVIQGGDPKGNGTGGPGYTIADEAVTARYQRGTVAMARTAAPHSQGSQFFIVLDDGAGAVLAQANTYAILGSVTLGMETVDAIAAMPNSGDPNNAALQPVAMTRVTVSPP
jgi:peptidyl-prolyl cis-trans isomerase B (cyclophilin B)